MRLARVSASPMFPRVGADLQVVAAVRNNLWDWQRLSPTSDGGRFYEFCNALEVKNGVSAGPEGWGLDHALRAWATYWTKTYHFSSACSESPCRTRAPLY